MVNPLYTTGKLIKSIWDSPLYISRGVRLYFSKHIVFFCLKIFFTFTNNVDPDEMQHYVAFHLALHCFRGFLNTKGSHQN